MSIGHYVRRRDRRAAQAQEATRAELDASAVEATAEPTEAAPLIIRINGQPLPLDSRVMKSQLAEFMSVFTADLHEVSERNIQARALISGLRGLVVGALPFLRGAIGEQRNRGMRIPMLPPLPRRHDPLGHLSQWMGEAFVDMLAAGEIQIDAAVTEAGTLAVQAVRFVPAAQLALPAPCEDCGKDDTEDDAPALVEADEPGAIEGGYQDISATPESGASADQEDNRQ